jgi:membrane protease subunit HflK
LKPTIDGYCITRSEKRSEVGAAADTRPDELLRAEYDIIYRKGRLEVELKNLYVAGDQGLARAGSDGSDYNIVHTKWQLTYQIDDPEQFFRNVYVEDAGPGEIYFDVTKKSITPLLENLFEGAVVTAMVNYTIDEAISSLDRIPKHVKGLLQDKLDKIESGIKVVSVQLTKSECPRQVKIAFEASTMASQTSEGEITSARTYDVNTINETAGPVAYDLLRDKKSVAELSEQEEELLWSQLAGTARTEITEARTYQASVVEKAKAEADYLESLLPEYRQRPDLVVQRLYLDAIESIFANGDEKFVVQTAKGAKGKEIWVRLSRDPLLKPKTDGTQTTQEDR